MASEKSDKPTEEKQTVDYNAKARVILLVTEEEKGEEHDMKVLLWEGKIGNEDEEKKERRFKPTDEELDAFLEKNKSELNHGDLLVTNMERASSALIVNYDENLNKFSTIKNPDESAAGYLTLTSEIMKNVTNAMEKYADVFEYSETSYLNMHISPKDEFIKERLGDEVSISFTCNRSIPVHM